MSSLPFSLGHYTPRKLTTPSLTRQIISNNNNNLQVPTTTTSSSSKLSNIQDHDDNPTLLEPIRRRRRSSRREAIGVGLCLGLVDVLFWQPQSRAETCEFTIAPSGLAYCDKLVGTGPEAVKGQLIKAHYVGKLENGKVFDSSYNRGKPLSFRIGVGEVIKGWDQGILGSDGVPPMLAGGKRTLKLPPELGYGVRGAGCRGGSCIIPPDSVLLFDVEFIGKAS